MSGDGEYPRNLKREPGPPGRKLVTGVNSNDGVEYGYVFVFLIQYPQECPEFDHRLRFYAIVYEGTTRDPSQTLLW